MEQQLEFRTHGTCSSRILITVEDDIVKNVEFVGGCSGNTQGIAALVRGMKVQDAVSYTHLRRSPRLSLLKRRR